MAVTDTIKVIVALIAFFSPYFLIPYTFKLASSTLANITGAVNDRSKGLLDRTKKWSQAEQQARREHNKMRGFNDLKDPNASMGRKFLGRIRTRRLYGRETDPKELEKSYLGRRRLKSLAYRRQGITDITAQKYGAEQETLKQAQEEAEVTLNVNKYNRETVGMDFKGKLDFLKEKLINESSSFAERSAALKLLAQVKDPGLEIVREFDLAVDDPDSGIGKNARAARNKLINSNFSDIDPVAPDITRPIRNVSDPVEQAKVVEGRLAVIHAGPAKFAEYGNKTQKEIIRQHIHDAPSAIEYISAATQTINVAPPNLSLDKVDAIEKEIRAQIKGTTHETDPNVIAALANFDNARARYEEGRPPPVEVI